MEGRTEYCQICGSSASESALKRGRGRLYCAAHAPKTATKARNRRDRQERLGEAQSWGDIMRTALEKELEGAAREVEEAREATVEVVNNCYEVIEEQIRACYHRCLDLCASAPLPPSPPCSPPRLLRVLVFPNLLQIVQSITKTVILTDPETIPEYIARISDPNRRTRLLADLISEIDDVIQQSDDLSELAFAVEAGFEAVSLGVQPDFAQKLLKTVVRRANAVKGYEKQHLEQYLSKKAADVGVSLRFRLKEIESRRKRKKIAQIRDDFGSNLTLLKIELDRFPNLSAAKEFFGVTITIKEFGESQSQLSDLTLEKTQTAKQYYDTHFPDSAAHFALCRQLDSIREIGRLEGEREAERIAKVDLDGTSALVTLLKSRGDNSMILGDFEGAVRIYEAAIESCYPYTPFTSRLISLYLALGRLCLKVRGEELRAANCYEKAYILTKTLEDSDRSDQLICEIAGLYEKMKELGKAESWECLFLRTRKRFRPADLSLPAASKFRKLYDPSSSL